MVMLASVLCAAFAAFMIGSVLVRLLGWPTNTHALGRWFLALLVSSLLFSMAPAIVRRVSLVTGGLPSVPLDELLPALFVIAVSVLGYVAWRRGEGTRERTRELDDATRFQERRRAEAPAPTTAPEGGRFRAAPRAGDHEP